MSALHDIYIYIYIFVDSHVLSSDLTPPHISWPINGRFVDLS